MFPSFILLSSFSKKKSITISKQQKKKNMCDFDLSVAHINKYKNTASEKYIKLHKESSMLCILIIIFLQHVREEKETTMTSH